MLLVAIVVVVTGLRLLVLRVHWTSQCVYRAESDAEHKETVNALKGVRMGTYNSKMLKNISVLKDVVAGFDQKLIMQMKHQLDATLCRFYFCRVTLHVSGASAHHQEYLKLVQRYCTRWLHSFCTVFF